MKSQPAVVSWSCVALGAMTLIVTSLLGRPLGTVAGIAILAVGVGVVGWSIRSVRPHPAHLLAVAALGMSVGAAMWLAEPGALELAVSLALVLAFAGLLHRRSATSTGSGGVSTRDGIDGLIVLIGGALATWITIVEPAISRGGHSASHIVILAAPVPLHIVVLGMGAVYVSRGLLRNRSAWLLLFAAAAHLAGELAHLVHQSGAFGWNTRAWWLATGFTAFLLAVAAMVHPSVLQSRRPSAGSGSARVGVRLGIVLTFAALPLTLIAAIPSTTSADRAMRVIGTFTIVALVALRLVGALAASNTAERRLSDRSRYDELTRLPNRIQLLDEITEVLDDTWRTRNRPSVLQLNVDRFKNVNDSLGHALANAVLLEIAGRLRHSAASFDAIVARTSGDEFVIMIPNATDDQAFVRAEEIRQAFASAIVVGDHSVFMTASIGLAVAPVNRIISAEEFLRRADVAMHRAKANGRNRVERFDDSMLANVSHRLDIENALHGAIDRREFSLDHQPIVDVDTGEVSGFEALIRWRRSDGTLMRPDQFIAIAEETGIINEMGAWALLEALTELRHWIEAGIVAPTATMSVNVSPRQIADPRLPEIVRDAVTRSGVPAHLLWIEVTESMMLSEPEMARATLREIGAMGVRVALDDFGTGYSSLSLLQSFPLQRLKIDRSFISGLADNSQDRSLVRTIIAMGQSLGLDIVAEGVETVEQLETLQELRCAKAQGFLISRPVPAAAMNSTMTALRDLGTLSVFKKSPMTVRPSQAAQVDQLTSR